ncbi:Monoamine oxidase [Klebsiella michiganensis]|uniref:Monoamine oxidase n=1 Tax=Klebsiella michiganensis TaxID=1134687 RepID=A0A7H4MZU4_9ENTR|nr:Monoamine oxidase [Klebsiella michiganensis]
MASSRTRGLLKVVSYLDVGDGNYWAHPIENLVAVVDLEQKEDHQNRRGADDPGTYGSPPL